MLKAWPYVTDASIQIRVDGGDVRAEFDLLEILDQIPTQHEVDEGMHYRRLASAIGTLEVIKARLVSRLEHAIQLDNAGIQLDNA